MIKMTSRLRAGAIAATFALAGLGGTAAIADEASAKSIVKSMTDYLAAQPKLSFNFDTTLQIVTADDQKLDIASSGSIAVARPDKFHATRHGGFASVDAVYDGKTLSVMNTDSKIYGQAEFKGTIDETLLHKAFDGRDAPAAGQTYPTTFVTGIPRAVKPFRTATRTWNSAT